MLGMKTCTPVAVFIKSWEVLPGQVLQGLGWGQSASSRQSLGTEGSRLREGGTLASSTGRG